MTELLLSFVVVSFALVGMALGALLAGKELKGSCGGLGAIMGEDCLFCEKKDTCEKRLNASLKDDLTVGMIDIEKLK